jgi:glycosyltransferase involved in cell wall biosynthesis
VRVAIVHHWFVTRGGGERVAETIASLFPEAELFTLMAEEREVPEALRVRRMHTSFLQRTPLALRYHREMMPLYPLATESLDLRGFDLVISSDSGPVKGVRVDAGAVHICYCHSPMRYLWDKTSEYKARMPPVTRFFFSLWARRVKRWDWQAAQRVTAFIANSHYVAEKIARFYGRESTVIHPPIDIQEAGGGDVPVGRHYLVAGRMVAYKRTAILLEACTRLGREVRVVGTGPDEAQLRAGAGAGVTFLGEISTPELWREYARCRALLFAADEDFGMVPLEAQACGRPVIAYGQGGSLETVRGEWPGATGVFYAEQTVESVMAGILAFEAVEGRFDPAVVRARAEEFGKAVFLGKMRAFILAAMPAAEVVMVAAPEEVGSWKG